MHQQKKSTIVIRSGFVLFLALALWSPAKAQSGTPAEGKMMEHCKDMKEQKQKMKEDMKAQDAKLKERLAAMNGAQEGRMALMAEVITLMAEQRIAMTARHATMEEGMMKHMMEHMQKGAESMSQCSMMKGMMKSKGENSDGSHKEHQEKHE